MNKNPHTFRGFKNDVQSKIEYISAATLAEVLPSFILRLRNIYEFVVVKTKMFWA
jgi:hypothetical protein